jgi:hypothetical protein
MPSVGLEPAIPTTKRPQTYALDPKIMQEGIKTRLPMTWSLEHFCVSQILEVQRQTTKDSVVPCHSVGNTIY